MESQSAVRFESRFWKLIQKSKTRDSEIVGTREVCDDIVNEERT